MKIKLNDSEVKLVKRVTSDRSSYDKKKGFKDHRRAKKQTARFIETNGFGGEVAVCKLFNVFPDIVTDEVSEYDLVLSDGTKVEVKTTQYGHGKLIARRPSKEADIYVLVTGILPDYNIVGFVTADVVKAGKTELNGKDAYIVEQKDFTPIEELKPQNPYGDRRVNKKTKRNRKRQSRNSSVQRKVNNEGRSRRSTRRTRSKSRRSGRRGDQAFN